MNNTTAKATTRPQPVYPLPRPGADDNDPRFTYGLIFDIADALTRHGYPPPAGTDWPDLMSALFRFIYQENT